MADVVCRQLGFPHGTRVDPLTSRPRRPARGDGNSSSPDTGTTDYYYTSDYGVFAPEEAVEPVERFWLSEVACSGPEGRLIDCDLGPGFRNNNAGCSGNPHRIHVACRQFPVVEALEAEADPGAGACNRRSNELSHFICCNKHDASTENLGQALAPAIHCLVQMRLRG